MFEVAYRKAEVIIVLVVKGDSQRVQNRGNLCRTS